MTIEEAIQHCEEVAHEKRIESCECISVNDLENAEACYECGEEHKQLAEWLTELKQRREAEITAPPKSNEEHTAAYWMQKTMDAAHEAYDRLKDTVDFKNAIAEAEAIKQRMGIGEKRKITNADRIRRMTDEELAEWFAPHMMCNICYKEDKPNGCDRNECKKHALSYMKQEVSEDATD